MTVFRPWHGTFDVDKDKLIDEYNTYIKSPECHPVAKIKHDHAVSESEDKDWKKDPVQENTFCNQEACNNDIDPETRTAVEMHGSLFSHVDTPDLLQGADFGVNHDWTAREKMLPFGMTLEDASTWLMDKKKTSPGSAGH